MSKFKKLFLTALLLSFKSKICHSVDQNIEKPPVKISITKKILNKVFYVFFEELKTPENYTRVDKEEILIDEATYKKEHIVEIADDEIKKLRYICMLESRNLKLTEREIEHLRMKCNIECNTIDVKLHQDLVDLDTKVLNTIDKMRSDEKKKK